MSMEAIYQISGISRQGYFQKKKHLEQELFYLQRTEEIVRAVRKDHPKMGSRPMHYMLKIEIAGINKFERLVSESGLGIQKKRLWIKTTQSNHHYYKYSNLTNGLELTGINQLWVSDITYWLHSDQVYYIIFIQDVYSRYILGYRVSNNMYAINNIKALNMAFKARQGNIFRDLIHHSDKGSQYCSDEYVNTLSKAKIAISMAGNSLENPYAERLNGIIKNDYLKAYETSTMSKLRKALDKVVWLYNNKRPHSELDYLPPGEYEKRLAQIPIEQRLVMKLYDFNKS